jgi:ASC-1-like (ASCH) protein
MEIPTFTVQEPYFSDIQAGRKTVEGRRGALNKFKKYIGKIVYFLNEDASQVRITDVTCYPDLYMFLVEVGYKKAIPDAKNIWEAVAVYHKFYTDASIKESGGMCGLYFTLLI